MRWLDTDKALVDAVASKLDVVAGPHAKVICEFDGVTFVGGALYDNYSGSVVHVHLYTAPGRKFSRRFLYCAFDYPFNQIGVKKLIGQVPSDNAAALKLNRHFGFVEEVTIKDYFPKCDLVVVSMTREQCHVLNAWPTSIKEAA